MVPRLPAQIYNQSPGCHPSLLPAQAAEVRARLLPPLPPCMSQTHHGSKAPPSGPALSPSDFEGLSTFILKDKVILKEKETELRSSWSFREDAEMSLLSTAVV